VLEAIDRLGSFAAAGRELHRATSAVSYAVRTLEDTLGVALFDRSGHRAVLTPAGRLLLGQAREVLEHARRLEHLATRLRDRWEPRIQVVLDGVLPMDPIMKAVRRFTEAGAPTELQLMVEFLSGVPERFEQTDADLMVTLDDSPEQAPRAEALPPVPMVLVAHERHPIHQQAPPRTRAQLAEHIELTVADSGRDAPRPSPLPLGSPHVFRLPDFHAKRQALLSGIGFGWLPRHLADPLLEQGTLRPLGFERGDHHVFTPRRVARSDVQLGRSAQLFARLLSEELDGSSSGAH
jgi:DNA-binding transcriptional LysR family regulator